MRNMDDDDDDKEVTQEERGRTGKKSSSNEQSTDQKVTINTTKTLVGNCEKPVWVKLLYRY